MSTNWVEHFLIVFIICHLLLQSQLQEINLTALFLPTCSIPSPISKYLQLVPMNIRSILPSITNASTFSKLDIGRNHFTGQVPSLGKLQDIHFLSMSWNNFGGNTTNDLEFLKSMTNSSKFAIRQVYRLSSQFTKFVVKIVFSGTWITHFLR